MTTAAEIRKYIASLPVGESFPASALRRLGSTGNVRQVLNRLVKSGELQRVARGVFVKPVYIPEIGNVLPSALEVAETLAKSTGESIAIHGAEAARQLQLTTQVPMQMIFYTSGNTRTLVIANRTVKLKHVNPGRLMASGTKAGLAISALSYLGRRNVSTETIKAIKRRISLEDFNSLFELVDRMPTWMADLFYHYKKEGENHE